MFERRLLTNAVIAALENVSGVAVGDAYAPVVPYGWSDTPHSPGSSFVPYVVCVPGSISDISGSISRPDFNMWVPYQVSGFGSSREQCEWVMDATRGALKTITGTSIDTTPKWKVGFVETMKLLGGIVRGGPEDQPVFGETDTFILFMSEDMA